MAAGPPAGNSGSPQVVSIPVSGSAGIGNLAISPPTFLEKWGVVFVAVGGVWMLCECVVILWYYLHHLSPPPMQGSGVTTEEYKAMLDAHKTATDQFRESVSFVFDLLVTKTILPLLTLLLGYLFGSRGRVTQ
jgi:uncharacterized membrane protein